MEQVVKIIKKTIEIKAPKETVWEVLFQDKFTRIWYAAFSAGSHAETDWQLGSKALFMDNSQCGIVGTVTEMEPYELLTITYDGIVTAGQEDYESTDAQAVKGCQETYALTGKDGTSLLLITCDSSAEYYNFMLTAWDKALLTIKQLAEEL